MKKRMSYLKVNLREKKKKFKAIHFLVTKPQQLVKKRTLNDTHNHKENTMSKMSMKEKKK